MTKGCRTVKAAQGPRLSRRLARHIPNHSPGTRMHAEPETIMMIIEASHGMTVPRDGGSTCMSLNRLCARSSQR